jgi:CheY-like chemotaxis protein
MNYKGIPCCYFPTNIILVDDDKHFVKNLRLAVKRDFPCIDFQDPQEALAFIQSKQPDPFTHRCLIQNDEFKTDETNIKVNVRAIHKEIFNSKRHHEISIVVVDYQMPHMDGIEFCRQLSGMGHIKKIMLTGEADHTLAVTAFNEGLIDKFIRKDEAGNINDLVCQAVKQMQLEYFLDLSAPIMNSLRDSSERLSAALKDLVFADWFYHFIQSQDFTEFYLLETQANFLLLGRAGRLGWLVVRDANEMQDLIQLTSRLYGEEPSDEARSNFEKIQSKNYLPLFYSEQDSQSSIDDWSPFLHRCSELKTEQNVYYWAFVEGPAAYQLDINKIHFFNSCFTS